jgi:hypothetical protein
MPPDSIARQIHRQVSSWTGVRVDEDYQGLTFFYLGEREIGHLHGSRFADIPFPVRIRQRLVAEGRANPHYLHPESGWITYQIRGDEDVGPVVELFLLNYHRPWLSRITRGDGSKDNLPKIPA